MYKAILTALVAGFSMLSPATAQAQTANACDLNANGVVDIQDVQLAVNMALSQTPCTSTAKVVGANVCNIVLIQRVTNAALNGPCVTGVPHSATLNWTASTSSNVTGYHVYRGTVANGPYTKLTTTPVSGTSYTDVTVLAGKTYYYVTTAVDASGNESVYSNQATAVVPTP